EVLEAEVDAERRLVLAEEAPRVFDVAVRPGRRDADRHIVPVRLLARGEYREELVQAGHALDGVRGRASADQDRAQARGGGAENVDLVEVPDVSARGGWKAELAGRGAKNPGVRLFEADFRRVQDDLEML